MAKAKYFTWDEDATDVENTGWALGYDYNFSKRTQVYALWVDSTIDIPDASDVETSSFGVGINHNF